MIRFVEKFLLIISIEIIIGLRICLKLDKIINVFNTDSDFY